MAKTYATSQIKNVAILGHQGVGKTSLLESILFANKKVSAKGKVDNGSGVCAIQILESIFVLSTEYLPNVSLL